MRVLIAVPDGSLRDELTAELTRVPNLHLAEPLRAFPNLDELIRTIRVQRPDFLIVGVDDFSKVDALLNNLYDLLPGLPMVGIARHVDEELGHKLMRLGIREYLVPPVTGDKLRGIIDFVRGQLERHPLPVAGAADLFTFLPAKPGVGTTTIALGVSCALAEAMSVRTLLLDCDLAAGMIGFHLKLGNSASILDAMNHAEDLDDDMWRQMVGKRDKLEVLHAGNLTPPMYLNPSGIQRILSLARVQYEVICADLASDLNELSVALLRESQRIFLVTTPEVAPVHLAQARLRSLGELGLAGKVSLVLNRRDHWRDHLDAAAVAAATGIPVGYSIGNDYRTCSDAVVNGSSIPNQSDIGRGILALAQSLRADLPRKAALEPHKRKFLEFFYVSRAEDPTTVWHD